MKTIGSARRQVIGWLLAVAGALVVISQYDPLTFYYWFPMDSYRFAPFAEFLLQLDRTPVFFTVTRMVLAIGLILIALWVTTLKSARRALLAVAVILAVEALGLPWVPIGEPRGFSYQLAYVLLAVGFLTSGVLALNGRIFLPPRELALLSRPGPLRARFRHIPCRGHLQRRPRLPARCTRQVGGSYRI